MPMKAAQLAALVERARQTPPPVVSMPPRQPQPNSKGSAKSGAIAPKPPDMRMPSAARPPHRAAEAAVPAPAVLPQPPPLAPPPIDPVTEAEDFPLGWALTKESWHFHRRFFRIFRRPMHRGEYSHLLWQIRLGKAEPLCEGCWRVTLPDGKRTLLVRATRWQLITILPRDWQPPVQQQHSLTSAEAAKD